MAEPDFIFQTAEPMSDVEHHQFIQACLTEAKTQGGTFFRVTQHEDDANLILVEVWKETPQDQGEPRWQARAPKPS